MQLQQFLEQRTISAMRNFGHYVIEHSDSISGKKFSREFWKLQHQFSNSDDIDTFCNESDILADALYDKKEDNLVGIIMGILCKTNEHRPEALEYFAWKGFDIARINHDFVHMIARLNDLKNIYINNPDRVRDYLDVIFRQEHCLHKLTSYYDDVRKDYMTVTRPIAPLSTYEKMLAFVQTEIGKYTKYSNPRDAHYKLTSAHNIFTAQNDKENAQFTKHLLDEIEQNSKQYENNEATYFKTA